MLGCEECLQGSRVLGNVLLLMHNVIVRPKWPPMPIVRPQKHNCQPELHSTGFSITKTRSGQLTNIGRTRPRISKVKEAATLSPTEGCWSSSQLMKEDGLHTLAFSQSCILWMLEEPCPSSTHQWFMYLNIYMEKMLVGFSDLAVILVMDKWLKLLDNCLCVFPQGLTR